MITYYLNLYYLILLLFAYFMKILKIYFFNLLYF